MPALWGDKVQMRNLRLAILAIVACIAIALVNDGLWYGNTRALAIGMGLFCAAIIPLIYIGWLR